MLAFYRPLPRIVRNATNESLCAPFVLAIDGFGWYVAWDLGMTMSVEEAKPFNGVSEAVRFCTKTKWAGLVPILLKEAKRA